MIHTHTHSQVAAAVPLKLMYYSYWTMLYTGWMTVGACFVFFLLGGVLQWYVCVVIAV